ncbi:MAG: CpXC domain-containing protein [Treponema sp.]|jgi:hypothetical protein|nr:CpXC domain-containing protein [Treponema sp.]
MKQKINCFCDNSFEIEIPEEINLDSNKEYMEEIQNGSFFSFICPGCGKKHKPEFPISILWLSKNLRFEVLPELDRGEFYRRKKQPAADIPMETIIGYPEMSDRLAIIRDGYEPVAIEAIKYFLQLKAEEQYPEDEIAIWYFGTTEDTIEFHIHGIKANEVAVMKVPLSLYQKTLDDYKENPKKEIFSVLRVRNYLSVKNTTRYEALK